MSGLITIVGAGPGDPKLITRKGVNRLRNADVVFHDKLSPNELLKEYCSSDTIIHDVGKRKGKTGPNQDEINERLREAAENYDRVVRLKGGDPFLFGRGGEETEYLAEHDLDFEIVPGVSSLTAVPASAGIPITHRDYASNIGIITGHFNRNADQQAHDWDALAQLDTLVVLMGVTRSQQIANNLMKAGKAPETPVAIVGWGATPRQNSYVTTLETLSEGLDDTASYLPGLIIIGEVVRSRPKLNWYETQPLFGREILVTRPENQANRLTDRLKRAGARTHQLPTIDITPVREGLEILRNTIDRLETFDWLVFTSRNAVNYFFEELRDSDRDLRSLGSLRLATIGPGTADRLAEEGFQRDLLPEEHRAEALADALLDTIDPESSLLLPRSADSRSHLADRLTENDHRVDEIDLYRAGPPKTSTVEQLREHLSDPTADMITFTSSSTVNNLFESIETELVRKGLEQMDIACIGPITAETLEDYGVTANIIPDNYNLDAFYNRILKHYQSD
jgi:uroporphyrinogen III methyltransferase/synthase